MRVLVTGAAGFIGSHVVRTLLAAGHEVVALDDLSEGDPRAVDRRARFYLMDIRSPLLERVFELERPEVISHQAAQISVPRSVEDPLFDADVNVLGTLNLLRCAARWGARKVILASSGGAIYGEAEAIPTPEDAPLRPVSPYAISKLAAERYLEFFHREHGLEYTVLRYANVYGPGQVPRGEAAVVAIFTENLLRGRPCVVYRYPDEPEGMLRDYCYVEDVARANLLALEGGRGEVLNIGTGRATSTLELHRTLVRAFLRHGVDLPRELRDPRFGPPRPGDLRRSCLDPTRAARRLGWRPQVSLEEGLERTVRWRLSLQR